MSQQSEKGRQRPAPPIPAYDGDLPPLFASYSHEDSAAVYAELKWLHQAGYPVWYDVGIGVASDWSDEIARALDRCACIMVFISPRSVLSSVVRNEINYALNHGKPVVPVHLEETTLTGGLELRLGGTQAILKYRMDRKPYRRVIEQTLSAYLRRADAAGVREATPGLKVPDDLGVSPPPPEPKGELVKLPQFHYGSVVPPQYFIDREKELSDAECILRAGQGFLLVGQRRSGKTSFCKKLIHQIMGSPGNQVLAAYLNLQNLHQDPGLTIETFLEHTILNMIGEIARQVFGCKYSDLKRSNPEEAQDSLRNDKLFHEFVDIVRLVFNRTHSHPGMASSPSPLRSHEFIEFVCELLAIIRARGWNHCAFFYDEANRLPRDLSVEVLISNSEALHAAGVLCVYTASPEMVESFRPLHESFDCSVELGPFTRREDLLHLLARYYFDNSARTSDLPMTAEAIEQLWELTRGAPYRIQLLAGRSFRCAYEEQAAVLNGGHVVRAYDLLKAERPLAFSGDR